MDRTEAEALGWVFAHSQPDAYEDKGDGVLKKIEGNCRAEKAVGGLLVNQSARDEAGLLVAIADYEDHLARRQQPAVEIVGDPAAEPAALELAPAPAEPEPEAVEEPGIETTDTFDAAKLYAGAEEIEDAASVEPEESVAGLDVESDGRTPAEPEVEEIDPDSVQA